MAPIVSLVRPRISFALDTGNLPNTGVYDKSRKAAESWIDRGKPAMATFAKADSSPANALPQRHVSQLATPFLPW